ncbi:MAG: endonuclease III [Bacillota bacterium]|nr:endonuclease III [Bacillota bacterium]
MNNQEKILEIIKEEYVGMGCGLSFKSPYQLLIATMLSAQCTDKRVNIVTDELFKNYDTPEKMTKLTEEELGKIIKSCGLYKNKSKNILKATREIIEEHEGKVPDTFDELIKLSGVGRKTANVVLYNAFAIPTMAVDTHVFRVSNRLGIGKGKNPEEVEKKLTGLIDREDLGKFHHYLICHGRLVCTARNPKCDKCSLSSYCEFFNGLKEYNRDS